jgi:hypothetical protein
MSDTYSSGTTETSSTEEADEWAPPSGREYLAHTRRVYGGGTTPWASGLEERASATHNSAVAARNLDAAQDAMAQAYDAFNDALDVDTDAPLPTSDEEWRIDAERKAMIRTIMIDYNRVARRLRDLIAQIESDPHHPPLSSWQQKSKRWDRDQRKWGGK